VALVLEKGKYLTRGEAYLLGGSLLLTRTTFGAGEVLPAHSHQEGYLATVVKGEYLEEGPDFSDEVMPGTAIFHPARETHSDIIGSHGAVVMNLELPEAFWEEKGISELKPEGRRVKSDPRFLELARKISTEMDNPKRQSTIGMEAHALEIIDIFLKLAHQPQAGADVLKQADAFIQENYQSPLTTEDIANRLKVPTDSLARKFRLHFGETITDRIIRLRLNEAIRLLERGSMTLAEIAVAAGFFDQSHFAKALKKRHGLSPGQYRRTIKKP
jgi:AraC-like DNA-binding protein